MKFGQEIRRIARCGSTMDEVRTLALAGAPEGLVVVAEEQTAGRGTKGRAWHSPPGTGLYATFLFRPASGGALVPLVVGVALREAASEIAPDVRIKWPNDLVWAGRKIAGVLCEGGVDGQGSRFVTAGIGINVGQAPGAFPPELAARSASLRMAAGRPVDRDALFARLCAALETWYNTLTRGAGEEIVREFEVGMIFARGDRISLDAAGARIEGTYLGLDASGGLVCGTAEGRKTYYSAEVGTSGPG
jgi:BirA family transcriptional regulator, biotin operon repressor / biotin---[acetyl-CoA-carboxylase] ligase